MFRLKVSHLQDLTTFSLPDALPTLGIPQCLQLWNTSWLKLSKKVSVYINNEIRVRLSVNLINRITNPTIKTKTNFHYSSQMSRKIQLLETYPFC